MAYEVKTRASPDPAALEQYLASIEPARRQDDSRALLERMRAVTGVDPQLWGPSIVGFGRYTYRYATGHEGEAAKVGFAGRKASLVLYGLQDHKDAGPLMERLGPVKLGKGCLYVTRLDRLDLEVLDELVRLAWSLPDHVEGATYG